MSAVIVMYVGLPIAPFSQLMNCFTRVATPVVPLTL